MRAFPIKIVPWPIEIGGHGNNKITPVLAPIGLAHLYPGNLGDSVGLVAFFQSAGQKVFLPQGLGGQTGVDAGGTQKQQLTYPKTIGSVQYLGLNQQVVTNKLCRESLVGSYSSYPGCRRKNIIRSLLPEKRFDGFLAGRFSSSRERVRMF